MSHKKAKEVRAEMKRVRMELGVDPEVYYTEKIPTMGCPGCQKSGSFVLVLNNFIPAAERVVSVVCTQCTYFMPFKVDLNAARGLVPVEGDDA